MSVCVRVYTDYSAEVKNTIAIAKKLTWVAYRADCLSGSTFKASNSWPRFGREDENDPLDVAIGVLQGCPVAHELFLPPALGHLALELVAGAGAEMLRVRRRRRGARAAVTVGVGETAGPAGAEEYEPAPVNQQLEADRPAKLDALPHQGLEGLRD